LIGFAVKFDPGAARPALNWSLLTSFPGSEVAIFSPEDIIALSGVVRFNRTAAAPTARKDLGGFFSPAYQCNYVGAERKGSGIYWFPFRSRTWASCMYGWLHKDFAVSRSELLQRWDNVQRACAK